MPSFSKAFLQKALMDEVMPLRALLTTQGLTITLECTIFRVSGVLVDLEAHP
jgi:hypothetical protein